MYLYSKATSERTSLLDWESSLTSRSHNQWSTDEGPALWTILESFTFGPKAYSHNQSVANLYIQGLILFNDLPFRITHLIKQINQSMIWWSGEPSSMMLQFDFLFEI